MFWTVQNKHWSHVNLDIWKIVVWGKLEDDDNLHCVFVCLLPNNRAQVLKENGSAKLSWINVYKILFLKISEFRGDKVVVLHIDNFRDQKEILLGRQKNGCVVRSSTS